MSLMVKMSGRRWIDVREYAEFAGGYIEGSELVPLGELAGACEGWERTQPLMMVCKSGGRATQACELLRRRGFADVRVMAGGFDEWRLSGGAVMRMERRPWSLERQMRVGAGAMVLMSLGLAYLVSSMFLWWTGFVGAGLVFAGVTDICMMARALGKLPWNRASRAGG